MASYLVVSTVGRRPGALSACKMLEDGADCTFAQSNRMKSRSRQYFAPLLI
jgi:hypothetical protein